MSAIPTNPPSAPPARRPVPPLENGDRLTRAEFERRYQAMPGVKKAELIEGIVYMPSPVRITQHGQPHVILCTWMGYYYGRTPGLAGIGDNTTARFDEDNEPQPDLMLLLPKSVGGFAVIGPDGYVAGPPTLVAEIAASSVSLDLHAKFHTYRRTGVREYLVWRTDDVAVDWFVLRDGQYVPLPRDAAGIIRSEHFPGLWLDATALLVGDLPGVLRSVDAGVATPEHAEFVRRLTPPS
ncbi:MAG: Uma2 family endonuclease [Phycisphaerae bacterium]